jgi:hypothetical protein
LEYHPFGARWEIIGAGNRHKTKVEPNCTSERVPAMNTTAADIVRSYAEKYQGDAFYFAPGIPPKKLKNAIHAYAAGLQEGDVFLLMDTTLFGSAKNGWLMTGDSIFVHSMLGKPWRIAICEIQSLFLEQDKNPDISSLFVRINDPQGDVIAVLREHEAQLFAGMLREIKAALAPAQSELVVTTIARVPRLTLVRMVPLEQGRPRRYLFINLHLKGREFGKVENPKAGIFSHPSVMLEMKDDKVHARTDSKDVMVNDAALVGKRELVDRDRISLGKDEKMAVYEYQADPQAAKQSRQSQELAQGIVRQAGGKSPERIATGQFVVDRKGVKLVDGSGGKRLTWKEMDEVTFSADYNFIYKPTNNLGNAAGQGVAIGSAQAESFLESQRSSDLTAVFPAPMYKVEFLAKGTPVAKLEQVDQRACAMLDEGIELFAPMDLVKFK